MPTDEQTKVEPVRSGDRSNLRLRRTRDKHYTLEPINPGDFDDVPHSHLAPEFLRTEDVRKIFGIRRGSLYGLAKLGKVKSCLLRIRGNRLGVRLWSADSIRSYIHEQMDAANSVGTKR